MMLVEAIKASLQESKAAQGSRPEAEPPSGTDDRTTSAASPPAAPLPSPFSSSQQQRPASIQDGIAALNLAHTYKYSPTRQHTSPGKPPIPTAAGDQAVQRSQTDDPGHYRRSFTSPTRSAVILEDESADERADSANERADSASGAHLMTQLADSSLHLPPLWQGSSSMFHRAAPGAAPHPAAAAGAPPGAASPRSPGEGCTLLPGRTNSDKLRSGPHLAASLQDERAPQRSNSDTRQGRQSSTPLPSASKAQRRSADGTAARLSGQSPPDNQRRFLSLRNFTGLNFGRSKSAEGINRNDIPRSQSGSSASSQQLKPSPAKRAVR